MRRRRLAFGDFKPREVIDARLAVGYRVTLGGKISETR
jgi:hypothetical protein